MVDDASSDDTCSVAECSDDATGQLRIIRLERNAGPAAARNYALDQTLLPFVCVLDADDYMLPGRLERLVQEAEAGYDLVADDLLLSRDGTDQVSGSLFDAIPEVPDDIGLSAFVVGNLANPATPRRELGYLKPLIRRDFLEQRRVRYDATLRLGEDFILYATALANGARFKLLTTGGYVAIARPRLAEPSAPDRGSSGTTGGRRETAEAAGTFSGREACDPTASAADAIEVPATGDCSTSRTDTGCSGGWPVRHAALREQFPTRGEITWHRCQVILRHGATSPCSGHRSWSLPTCCGPWCSLSFCPFWQRVLLPRHMV